MHAPSMTPRSARLVWSRLSVRGLVERLIALDATARQRAHLEEMDDRMLRDIGVTRADVARELRRTIPW